MQKPLLPLLALLIAANYCACHADKITSDPNAPGARAAAKPVVETDPRLLKKVTIDCVNVRLHTAIERIADQTGVAIYTGKSSKDWSARDVPVVVCARELPLGKLLQAIADSTHLYLSSHKADNGEFSYRIWRDGAREKALAEYYDNFSAAETERAHYDWGLWTKLKDVPDSEFKERKYNPESAKRRHAEEKSVSAVVAALGPETRDKILNGGMVNVGMNSVPDSVKETLADLFQSTWRHSTAARARNGATTNTGTEGEITDSDLNKSMLTVGYSYSRRIADKSREIQIMALIGNLGCVSYDQDSVLRSLKQDQFKLGPRPEMPKPPAYREEGPDYTTLDPYKEEAPILREKAKIERWKGKKSPTCADVLAGLSQATGISIIAEDFESQTLGTILSRLSEIKEFFGKETAVREVLQFGFGPQWRLSADGDVILGPDRNWPEHLRNMVPEGVIDGLLAKLDGTGVELDDLESLAKLPRKESREWFYGRVDMEGLQHSASMLRAGSIWQLYYALDKRGRAHARAKGGASLAFLDRQWLADFFRKRISEMSGWRLAGDPISSVHSPHADTFSNPDTIPSLVLRLTRVEWPKRGVGKHGYVLSVEGVQDGQKIEFREDLGPFPVYSAEREAELAKSAAPQPARP